MMTIYSQCYLCIYPNCEGQWRLLVKMFVEKNPATRCETNSAAQRAKYTFIYCRLTIIPLCLFSQRICMLNIITIFPFNTNNITHSKQPPTSILTITQDNIKDKQLSLTFTDYL